MQKTRLVPEKDTDLALILKKETLSLPNSLFTKINLGGERKQHKNSLPVHRYLTGGL